MLGAARFAHIEHCTHDACVKFKLIEDIESHIQILHRLDETLADLRHRYKVLQDPGAERISHARGDYSSLLETVDLPRARRLVNARQGAIRSMQSLIKDYAQSN